MRSPLELHVCLTPLVLAAAFEKHRLVEVCRVNCVVNSNVEDRIFRRLLRSAIEKSHLIAIAFIVVAYTFQSRRIFIITNAHV